MCNGSTRQQGEPRIVDRTGGKRLPVGIESFADVIDQFVYVDKTLAVLDFVDNRGVTLYCRPRRFGKSTLLRMLQCFFEAPVEDFIPERPRLFDGLAISEAGERYSEHCGTHPVIYMNLAACGASSYEEFTARMTRMMSDEYIRHAYLLESPRLLPFEKPYYERVAAGVPEPGNLEASLSTLSKLLSRHHGSQVVILIDEYDTPVNDAHLNGFRKAVLDFYRAWLSDALKGTTDLFCAALTGVLRVSQESIFSELNNVQINTTLDEDLAEAIGFTEAEAEALAAHVGRAEQTGEMRAWYDGYRFGRARVYNPWSVLQFLRKGQAQPYWTNTSRNGIVTDLVARADATTTLELASLADGGEVVKPLDLRTVFDDLSENPQAVWAQLYQSGYVTTDDTGFANDSKRPRRLRVPNLEVAELFSEELIDRASRLAGSSDRLAALHRAITGADAEAAGQVLRRILLDSPSYHDLADEGDYHVLLLALLYDAPGYRPATSNRESGDGRCDVLLEPLPENAGALPAHAMELKLARDAKDDDALAAVARDVALAQARRLEYGHGLSGTGLVRWGIAFNGKRAACTCQKA